MTNKNVPSVLPSLKEIVEDFNQKWNNIDQLIKDFEKQVETVENGSTMGGTYVGCVFGRKPYPPHRNEVEKNLLKSAWRYVYNGMNIATIASASDRKKFDLTVEDPPHFTIDNIRASFGDYLVNTRHHILKGLAECFCDLDPYYKSHSKVKVGVKGLPKRIIIHNVGGYGYHNYGTEKLKDVINSLNAVSGDPHIKYDEFQTFIKDAKYGVSEYKGLKLKRFKNGNAHLIFSEHKLRQINDALIEFYGDVLPDAPSNETKKKATTDVAKDLQFYPTPLPVIERIVKSTIGRDSAARILEPSCGDGRIMDYLRKTYPNSKLQGIEVDPTRAQQAREKFHSVLTDNFLDVIPQEKFDFVVMNPPFYGTHWKKHLEHATKFLVPDGWLVCVLPATAKYDGHLKYFAYYQWHDLPVASFAESGTNIPTGFVVYRKKT